MPLIKDDKLTYTNKHLPPESALNDVHIHNVNIQFGKLITD